MNFYFVTDPHLAVGSIIKGGQSGYHWRCYTDPYAGVGTVADMKSAERQVLEHCRQAARHDVSHLVDAA